MKFRRARRRRLWLRLLALAALGAASLAGAGASSPLAETLARGHPGLRALVVARGACVAFEYYRAGFGPRTRAPVYSVTKSVLAILVGVAVDEGLMRLDEPLAALVPELLGADPMARGVTIRDLLTMTAGFETAPAGGPAVSLPAMLERPMRAPPGDRFAYDGLSADLLSVALSRAIRRGARMDARQFARRRLFDPLGIRDYAWSAQAEGSPRGETDLFLTPRDMARIGLLMLRGGRWGDRRIVSQGFVAEATSRRNPGGPPLGAAYGYLWWVTKTRAGLDAFFAAGSGGQLVYVVPALDLVVAVLAQAADGDSPDLVDMIASSAPAGAPCVDRLGSEPR